VNLFTALIKFRVLRCQYQGAEVLFRSKFASEFIASETYIKL